MRAEQPQTTPEQVCSVETFNDNNPQFKSFFLFVLCVLRQEASSSSTHLHRLAVNSYVGMHVFDVEGTRW